jgi:hypothetical protein
MRIISNEHDYYDGVQATGQERSVVYARTPVTLDPRQAPHTPEMLSLRPIRFAIGREAERRFDKRLPARIAPFAIVFCGRIYYGARLIAPLACFDPDTQRRQVESVIHYDPKALARDYQALRADRRLGAKSQRRRFRWGFDCLRLQELMARNGDERLAEPLAEAGITILTAAPGTRERGEIVFERDSLLAPYEFYQLFDAWSAFQEIAMWIGGVMARPERAAAPIGDEDLARAKGFDEWSFRRPPKPDRG